MKPTVIYDDTCEMCCNFINFIKSKKDKENKLEFVPLSKAKERINFLKNENYPLEKSVHFVVNESVVLSQIQAVQEICKRTNFFPYFYKIKSPILIYLFNLCYSFVAKHRKIFLFRFLSRLFL